MREGDAANPELDAAIFRSWNRLALACGGSERDKINEDTRMVHQHHEAVRVSERCSYLSAYDQARKNADTRATSRSRGVR